MVSLTYPWSPKKSQKKTLIDCIIALEWHKL